MSRRDGGVPVVASREDVRHDVAFDVGEAEVAAGVAVGEAFVVEAEEGEDRGVEVVDVDFVFGGEPAVVVGRTVGGAGFHAATGEPYREAVGVVIASVASALRGGGASEFAAEVDKPIAGLLKDLKARGLLDDTLVLWGGEFGRTPAAQGGRDGRDHNPDGFTVWLAGGGVKPGTAYGATDDYGWFATENKIHIHDLHATILALLGLDHERLTYRHAGRDFRLTDVEGHVVTDIFA